MTEEQRSRLTDLLQKMRDASWHQVKHNDFARARIQIDSLVAFLAGASCGRTAEEWIAIAEKVVGAQTPADRQGFEPFDYCERS